jgi:VWA domain-containing protein/aerotolerance regulator-like protein
MQLLQPAMLSILGLIPVLILIHMLKPKPRPVEVTNLFLWQTVLKERAGQTRISRLKKNLPLLLQILIILLTAFSLAQPVFTYLTKKSGNIILVIDTSASMKTRGASGTRFDRAVEKALEILGRRKTPQKALIIEAGYQPKLVTGFDTDSERVKSLVKDLRPSDTPADLEKAVSLAISFVDPSREDTIYLLTDGAGFDLWRLLKRHPGIEPVIVSSGKKNIGITKFVFRKTPGNGHEILLEVANFTPIPVVCPIRLAVDRSIILETEIMLEGEEKKRLVLPYSVLVTGIAKVVIDVDDAFTVDNTAYAALNAAEDIWVLLVSKGNYFLDKLLGAYPNVMVNRVKEVTPSSWLEQARRHDIVIVDRMDFPATENGNFILINAFSPSIPVVKSGRTTYPEILDWDAESPLMSGIDPRGLIIEEAAVLNGGPGVRPIVEAHDTGLMYTYEREAFRSVLLNFDITRSDLPLRVAFPVLFGNILNWLNPQKRDFSTLQTRTGEPIDIYTDPQTDRLFIRPPGKKWETHPVRSNRLTYAETDRVGIYTVKERNKRRHFAVNLANESESDIRGPAMDSDIGRPDRGSRAKETAAGWPLWPVLILSALGVLMMEWYYWLKFG